MRHAVLVLCLFPEALLAASGPPDEGADDVRPGLVAEYHSLADPRAGIVRVEAKPAFFLGTSSPHPRLPPGPFEVVWKGLVALRDAGPVVFSASAGGEVKVVVDGVVVLDGRGRADGERLKGKELTRKPGNYPLEVRFRSAADAPARLQMWWQGPGFAAEAVPAWQFGHADGQETPALGREMLAARGREAAGRLGCARCHAGALPGMDDPPPGPSLADAGRRLDRGWLLRWLADPAGVRAGAHMPALFSGDRAGLIERWIVAGHLLGEKGGAGRAGRAAGEAGGDHRKGRIAFLGVGCAACHLVPDLAPGEQADLNRVPLIGLGDRLPAAELAAFLAEPHGRYPDGRMPRVPLSPAEARDISAYLLLWAKPAPAPAGPEPPSAEEVGEAVRRLGAKDRAEAAQVLLRERACQGCHPGLGEARARDVPLRATRGGCLGGGQGPRHALPEADVQALQAYLEAAGREKHSAAFAARQRRLARAGCVRCHQRDSDRPSPLEEAGSTLGGAHLQELPYQKAPRLSMPHQKFTRGHLAAAVREGVAGLRGGRYSYRMPAFGAEGAELVQALAEADGEIPVVADPPAPVEADPTLGTVHGPELAGSQGYGCVSCHVWDGRLLAAPDPGATGPDLTRTVGRIRRDWFDRYLESPQRFHPRTPMPAVLPHGQPAPLAAVLGGDAARQKDALWAYLARGKEAAAPRPPPPVPIAAPGKGEPVLVAQVPIRLPDGRAVESLTILSGEHDLLVYDLGEGGPRALFTGGQVLRTVQGRQRQFLAIGAATDLGMSPAVRLAARGETQAPAERVLLGYDRLSDGARLRWRVRFAAGWVELEETLRLPAGGGPRRLAREVRAAGVPEGCELEVACRVPPAWSVEAVRVGGEPRVVREGERLTVRVAPGQDRVAAVAVRYEVPAAKAAPAWEGRAAPVADPPGGSRVRPGYRAMAYPRPRTVSGEDRILPAAVAVRPRDGQVFVASLKTGELFALRDPSGDARSARFDNYARGLFQDALSLLAEDDALYVLHRRNLTRVVDADGDGVADRFDRVAALPHGVADTYDMAYGLARDRAGRFVFGYAPYANTTMPGSGGVLRLAPGRPPEEVAYGLRNPLGWCAGPAGDVFVTDNQGEWVATNKLVAVAEGKYYGFPNPAQRQHASRPLARPAVWVPYGWARSINGVAYDSTGGRFGPFAGQFFLAELMYGGAIVRAQVEKVNGVYQGACFPFWGQGLLGPVSLAFDPAGRLYVGGITEPGWMAQPDRGALFRIDYTGPVPFEMRSIHARPRGFRVVLTAPVDPKTAGDPASYRLEHYRYEYTGAYGSPELDRTAVQVVKVEVLADGRTVELTAAPLIADRVYLLSAAGVRSAAGEAVVHPTGAYTVNEVPAGER